jgi:hypothetical protein
MVYGEEKFGGREAIDSAFATGPNATDPLIAA